LLTEKLSFAKTRSYPYKSEGVSEEFVVNFLDG
jgi:hypothetical protein